MAKTYDVIVIGAGLDGLAAAAYLARAKRSVLVVEGRAVAGGRAATEELIEGYRASSFASVGTLSPEILRELELAANGLELSEPAGVFVATGDDRSLYLPSPGSALDTGVARSIAAVSRSDADAFERLDAFLRRLADGVAPVLGQPLPDPEPDGAGGWLALLKLLVGLRRLGRDDLAAALRFLPMPLHDVAEEHFEHPALAVAVAAGGLRGSWLGPRSPGGAATLLFHRCGLARGALGHPIFARGGSGAVADALARVARAAGAELRTDAMVARITVRGGAAKGVVLEDGEELRARAVLSTADPKKTFLELVEGQHLEPSFLFAARSIRARGTVGIVHFALDALPELAGAKDGARELAGRIHVAPDLDAVERAFDDAKYGRMPERPYLELAVPSLHDATLAPEDRHLLTAWVQYPPYHLRQGDWDERRDQLGDVVARTIESVAPGFTDRVLARRVLTPLDLERRYGVTEGCLYHVEPALDQLLYLRPLPRYARHRAPIAGLYLGGAGSHGGLGLSGLPGRNAARAILADG